MTPEDRKIEDRIRNNERHLIRELDRACAWQILGICLIGIACMMLLAGCNGDGASPFDKPDEGAQPVSCAASASCG